MGAYVEKLIMQVCQKAAGVLTRACSLSRFVSLFLHSSLSLSLAHAAGGH